MRIQSHFKHILMIKDAYKLTKKKVHFEYIMKTCLL